MINHKSVLVLVLVLLSFTTGFSQKERKYVRNGNDIYYSAIDDSMRVDTTLMQSAEVEYRKAIDKKPTSFEARNNLANSLYRQKKYKEASEEWEELTNINVSEKQKALVYHNLGNSLLMQSQLEKSIEAYKNALRNYPSDSATKYNLAFAQSKLKQQKKQQQKNKNNKDNKNKKNKDKDKSKQNKDKQNDKQKKDEKKQQSKEQKAKEQKAKEQNAKKSDKKEGAQKNKISKKDAMRILKAIEMDEKNLQKKMQHIKKKSKNTKKTDKDW